MCKLNCNQLTLFTQAWHWYQGSKFTGATALIAPSYTSIAPRDEKIADTQGPKMTPRSWKQSKVKSTVKWVTSSRHLVNSSILTVIFDLVQNFKTQLAWNHRIKPTKAYESALFGSRSMINYVDSFRFCQYEVLTPFEECNLTISNVGTTTCFQSPDRDDRYCIGPGCFIV